MQAGTPRLFVAIVALLTCAAAAALVVEAMGNESRQESRDFQLLVGGLGFGPRADLAGCALSFDPRLAGHCWGHGPLESGAAFCPEHGLSIFYYWPADDWSTLDADIP